MFSRAGLFWHFSRGVGPRTPQNTQSLRREPPNQPQDHASVPPVYNEDVDVSSPDADAADAVDLLTPEQRSWAQQSEALWQRAHAIAKAHPHVDAGDVYHALRCLELSPEERLRRGLGRGRLRAYAR
jgi:hypothetical protein